MYDYQDWFCQDQIVIGSRGMGFPKELSFEKGSEIIEIDSPSFLGGDGNRLGPWNDSMGQINSR